MIAGERRDFRTGIDAYNRHGTRTPSFSTWTSDFEFDKSRADRPQRGVYELTVEVGRSMGRLECLQPTKLTSSSRRRRRS